MPSKDISAEEDIRMINGWEHTVGTTADNVSLLEKNQWI